MNVGGLDSNLIRVFDFNRVPFPFDHLTPITDRIVGGIVPAR